eukprot:366116-Chlamydomonas_euryale.AAC.10
MDALREELRAANERADAEKARADAAEQELSDIIDALQGLRSVKMLLMVCLIEERRAITTLDLSSRRTSTDTCTNVETRACGTSRIPRLASTASDTVTHAAHFAPLGAAIREGL